MSQTQWSELSSVEFQLSGDLDRDSVPAIWRTLQAWKTTESRVQVNLNTVERIDSSGMVMLIHLIEHAKKSKLSYNAQFRARTITNVVPIEQYPANDGRTLKRLGRSYLWTAQKYKNY